MFIIESSKKRIDGVFPFLMEIEKKMSFDENNSFIDCFWVGAKIKNSILFREIICLDNFDADRIIIRWMEKL